MEVTMFLALGVLAGAYLIGSPVLRTIGSAMVGTEVVTGRLAKKAVVTYQENFSLDENPLRDSLHLIEGKENRICFSIPEELLSTIPEKFRRAYRGTYLLRENEAWQVVSAIKYLAETGNEGPVSMNYFRALSTTRWNNVKWAKYRPEGEPTPKYES